ncbi:Glycosyltransferase, catalytic subunit of cellulose synthase and poly-beta-1,6-N-acetylglucosamine synthase [Flavobacterium swingsii]|uniref:Glycosyltransferase, catalytic subunit of cellulose synthase and poly-beta-1,6-N-acetylglucosamine synthase n=1 Tax=Flavobacterium swingsii TaxID=498292 RepID=A0A1I0YHH3_9FLAO|nr:glycosyltransferase [Flavobacterium swingsii]SFB12661.1 Glycosyltransferase, catalytic subunit of cellulose synthase and poly-beta-1,6-N-acetylglucosamine synthase [Flavobacterium swingsii]
MEIVSCLFVCITIWYLLNIIWLIYGFTKVKSFENENLKPKTKFSIIIPFRNEQENLPKLLSSIEKLNYPNDLFEVILVDDESDFRFQILDFRFLQITLIDNIRKTNSPKKDAINTAISIAKNDWIITTDADCLVQPNWLATFDAFIQKNNPKMIAAGVFYKKKNGFLDAFQQLDFLSLQGTTIGSFGNKQAFMCNGANFCYQKTFFHELNGFDGNDKVASGDDVFLLQKAIMKDRNNVYFLKSEVAIVQTKTEKTWKDLFNQRVRWASKTGNYNSLYSKQLGISVLVMNLFWILSFCFLLLGMINTDYFVLLLFSKFLVDFVLLYKTSSFFKTRLNYVLFGSLLYPLFCVSVGFYSFFGSYSWKGRSFKK